MTEDVVDVEASDGQDQRGGDVPRRAPDGLVVLRQDEQDVVELEGVSEGERVVAALVASEVLVDVGIFLAVVVLEVAEVLATSAPALLLGLELGLLLLSLGVDQHLHAVVVQTLRLDHVQHVELDLLALLDVGHPEVEPLSVTLGVDVVLQNEVVLGV